jgi:hypothetical protein
MKKILSAREKNILYLTIGVVVFSVAFNIFIWPVLNKDAKLNTEIRQARARLNKYTRLLAQKDTILIKSSKLFSPLATLNQKMDTDVLALSELESLANDANVRIIDLRPQASRGSKKEIIIEARTEGTMESYMKFIYNIEQSLSSLTIKKFQINSRLGAQILEGTFTISQLPIPE